MEMIKPTTTIKTNDINQLIRSRTTTTARARAMQSRKERPKRRAAASLWRELSLSPPARKSLNLVIILICLGPSIIISCLVARAAAAAAAASPASLSSEVASAFDFSINSASNGELAPGGSRSLPYSSSNNFDPSSYKNIHEAIRGHPDLREFASLCELDGVKEIVSMDRTPLTVFAPIDRSLGDLLAKSKSRSINLIELAKHHIAQGLVTADENTKYPLQFSDYGLLSPLYLNQQQQQQPGGSKATAAAASNTFVNNAKILATHLIQIDSDNYQILHVIDQVIEFAYLSRKTQLASSGGGQFGSTSSLGGGGGSSAGQRQQPKIATKKSKFSLDDLLQPANEQQQQQSVLYDFYERFGDLASNQAQLDVFHARAYRAGSANLNRERLTLSRDELNLERLGRTIRQHRQLRGKLYHVNESQSYNTYFLPLNSDDELDKLLQLESAGGGESSALLALLEAMVIPDQVLFTRTMSLGIGHATLFDRHSQSHRVSLSLAKTMPPAGESSAADGGDSSDESRQLLSSPLLLQAKCQRIGTAATAAPSSGDNQQQQLTCRPGVTSVELVVANIPLSNGVLHLIRRPVLITDTNLLDYLNDNDNQLSNVLGASGSRTASGPVAAATDHHPAGLQIVVPPPKVNRFRELLARERQMLAGFSSSAGTNMTILAPSDEAFARLRYDLRALVLADEQLIPHDWSPSYRHDLLERLVKSHVILHESITSDQLDLSGQLQLSTDNGRPLTLLAERPSSNEQAGEYLVDCDSVRSRLIQHDLIGTNGVLHIIDRVLGEEQETVYSLLKSIVLRFNHSLAATNDESGGGARLPQDLAQLIQSNIRNSQRQQQQQQQQQLESTTISQQTNSLDASNIEQQQQQKMDPELGAISRSIGQYLDELAAGNRRQLQLLASSVNISYQLARLTSLAEGLDDWNDKFRQPERMFTYFVPSDLAWIRLQQAQPELHKPLMYFLESGSSAAATAAAQSKVDGAEAADSNGIAVATTAAAAAATARSSESSHRLRQILERHLVVNKKIAGRDLNQLDSVKTMGATLRLVEAPSQSQLTATYSGDGSSLNQQQQQATSNFAALHSIFTGTSAAAPPAATTQGNQMTQVAPKLKSLRLDSASANIVQANEASNGYVYVIDNVLLLPEDSNYIVQTSQSPAMSSSMSSLLGGHNSVVFDFVHNLLSPAALNLSTSSILALMATLTVAIAILLIIALVLVVRKRRQSKLNRHQQLESGLTSSSSANSGSTSTTKSL